MFVTLDQFLPCLLHESIMPPLMSYRIGVAICGRYARRSDKQRIAKLFAINGSVIIPDFGPSWNVAPQAFRPVIRLNCGSPVRATNAKSPPIAAGRLFLELGSLQPRDQVRLYNEKTSWEKARETTCDCRSAA
jgi:putative SOS response-associated peptidase YedK